MCTSAQLHARAFRSMRRERSLREALVAFGRPALHAKTLGFRHPETGERLAFDSELPEDFQAFRQALDALPAIVRSEG